MFPSKSFIVSGLTLKSLIHNEFIFVYGIEMCSNFIILCEAVHFFQEQFGEETLSPLYILAFFVKNKVSIDLWVYLFVFCLVPLVHNSIFVPVSYCLNDSKFVV